MTVCWLLERISNGTRVQVFIGNQELYNFKWNGRASCPFGESLFSDIIWSALMDAKICDFFFEHTYNQDWDYYEAQLKVYLKEEE